MSSGFHRLCLPLIMYHCDEPLPGAAKVLSIFSFLITHAGSQLDTHWPNRSSSLMLHIRNGDSHPQGRTACICTLAVKFVYDCIEKVLELRKVTICLHTTKMRWQLRDTGHEEKHCEEVVWYHNGSEQVKLPWIKDISLCSLWWWIWSCADDTCPENRIERSGNNQECSWNDGIKCRWQQK